MAIDLREGERQREWERGSTTHHTWTWPNAQIAEAEAATAAAAAREHALSLTLQLALLVSLPASPSLVFTLALSLFAHVNKRVCSWNKFLHCRSHHVAGFGLFWFSAVARRALFTAVTSPFWHFQLAAATWRRRRRRSSSSWHCVALLR